jgi:predicted transcriptional regulator
MKMDNKLGMMEMRFAELIWENAPIGSGELVKLCEKELCWKKSTTYTMLRRLCQRGLFQNENSVVTALITREEFDAKETMEFMEEKFGRGWWGSDDYATYYEDLGSNDDPFSYIKVIPLIGAEAQKKCGGFDHAGKWETSLLMGTYPELVDLSRCERNTEWFAQSAKEASEEIGRHMVNCTLEWLREAIQ